MRRSTWRSAATISTTGSALAKQVYAACPLDAGRHRRPGQPRGQPPRAARPDRPGQGGNARDQRGQYFQHDQHLHQRLRGIALHRSGDGEPVQYPRPAERSYRSHIDDLRNLLVSRHRAASRCLLGNVAPIEKDDVAGPDRPEIPAADRRGDGERYGQGPGQRRQAISTTSLRRYRSRRDSK